MSVAPGKEVLPIFVEQYLNNATGPGGDARIPSGSASVSAAPH